MDKKREEYSRILNSQTSAPGSAYLVIFYEFEEDEPPPSYYALLQMVEFKFHIDFLENHAKTS